MPSPKHDIIPEGHCQPGTGPIPRTSQTVHQRGMRDLPFGVRRPNLKVTSKTEYANTQQELTGIRYKSLSQTMEAREVLGFF
jgi:hypothetical protein